MMAHKHLHELLREDQEPFLLKNYIADRRFQFNKLTPKSPLHLKKSKPIINSSTSKRSLCRQACFFSFHDSPDVRKSPFLDFPSPAKSPNTLFLQIPAKTASLLLDAAMRIQKHSNSKPQIKKGGFGLFGSILKKLREKNRTQIKKRGINGVRVSEMGVGKSARKCEKVKENLVFVDEKSDFEMGFSCSCNNSRLSSAGWSESNQEKSLDLETSSSCRSEEADEIAFVDEERKSGGFGYWEEGFCSSPLSPFRFSLQKSHSSGRRTPEFFSPAASPSRCNKEEKENFEADSLQNIQPEEEEEKEQFSPVSVLEPPFEDDEDGHEGGDEEDGYDLECSYAIVQRAKQQFLLKLRRFERLAELDPIELEKRMLEEEDENDNEDLVEEEEFDKDESLSLYNEENVDEFVKEVFSKSSFHRLGKIPEDMKRLVSDLIAEEKNGVDSREAVMKRVCARLDSWKDVESNTIDMMVELDFRREVEGWKRYDQGQMGEVVMEIELAIFGLLVEELVF